MLRLRSAVFEAGIFAVTEHDQQEQHGGEPFGGALRSYATCAMGGHLEEELNKARSCALTSLGSCRANRAKHSALHTEPACCSPCCLNWSDTPMPIPNGQVNLADGTVRTTLATATNRSLAAALPSVVSLRCPGFAAASEGLRQTVDRSVKGGQVG